MCACSRLYLLVISGFGDRNRWQKLGGIANILNWARERKGIELKSTLTN